MDEKFEVICEGCSKAFETTDEDATLCPTCWEKTISLENEGKGDSE